MRKRERGRVIIFEDEKILVINKQSGVAVDVVQKQFAPMILAHRLDKDTSGVMVLAKNAEAYENLKQQFLERKVVKKYLALVHGELKGEGTISLPVERNPKDKSKFTIGKDLSRTAITDWRVEREVGDYSLMELTPHTGRTHQIRVHMRHLGHPIVSDPIYGNRKTWKEDLKWCPRLFLHAKYLEFTHPGTGERVKFEAEVPHDLAEVLRKLVN